MPIIVIFLFLIFISPAFAHAGPPLLTHDPGTPGDGHWENNVAITVEKARTHQRFEAPLLDLNYGWGERIQLKFEVPWVFLKEEGENTKNGLGDSLLGVKYRFIDQDRYGFDMSVYPQLELNNVESSVNRGLVDRGPKLSLPAQVAKRFGPLVLNLEVGYAFVREGPDQWITGLAFGYQALKKLELVGEVYGTSKRSLLHQEWVFNLGFRWRLAEKLILNIAAGRTIRPSPDDEPTFLLYTGLQFLL